MNRNAFYRISMGFVLAAFAAPGQVLNPVTGGLKAGEARRVYVLTLTYRGFEPRELMVNPGKVTIILRDLTGTTKGQVELRNGSRNANASFRKSKDSVWRLNEEFQFELGAGEAYLGVPESNHFCKLTVSQK